MKLEEENIEEKSRKWHAQNILSIESIFAI
jgi:hypothetical protein